VQCRLETGRTHQIRVHMMSIGFPLVGDTVYGKQHLADYFPRQALQRAAWAWCTGHRRAVRVGWCRWPTISPNCSRGRHRGTGTDLMSPSQWLIRTGRACPECGRAVDHPLRRRQPGAV
jgi:hypothetical protein